MYEICNFIAATQPIAKKQIARKVAQKAIKTGERATLFMGGKHDGTIKGRHTTRKAWWIITLDGGGETSADRKCFQVI